jgi:hypothetical protein
MNLINEEKHGSRRKAATEKTRQKSGGTQNEAS